MPKDYTKYKLNGELINYKSRLVEAVVTDYIESHKNITLSELEILFAPEIQQETEMWVPEASSAVVCAADKVIEKTYGKRYFKTEIPLADGQKVRICRGWDIWNIGAFIERARKLGYQIEEIK